MKYNAVFKFFAILLCAVFLLTAAASGVAIGVMGAMGLYGTDVRTLRREEITLRAEGYAYGVAEYYGSLTWGSCPEGLVESYFGTYGFSYALAEDRLGYAILDESGAQLEAAGTVGWSSYGFFDFPLEGFEYLAVVEEVVLEQTEDAAEQIPEETAAEEAAADKIGTGETEAEGDIREASAASETEPTVKPTLPEETEVTEAVETVPAIPDWQQEDTFLYGYYDDTTGTHREFLLRYEKAPPLTVRITLRDGDNDRAWELLQQLWNWRMELFAVLGGSLLLLALLLIYLCRAAGRKPGSQEVRAGGLNRIPLDIAGAAGAFCVAALVLLAYEGGEYIARQDILAAAFAVAAAGYGCSLILILFVFAFAAQVKTPDGFWWRNSLCALCVKVMLWAVNLLVSFLAWTVDILIQFLRWSWRVIRWRLLPLARRLARDLWKVTRFFWVKFREKALRIMRFCYRKLFRFVGMLPLTWQWLLAAFLMIFLLAMTVNSYRTGFVILGLVLTLAMVIYGASAFGTLLESAKRMRRGNLDTKVDESFLVGCFREFAQELNGLADVAVVAAQKQLKSERMKTELITNVSHDIKTPLTSIINYVDLLGKPHSEEEREQYLEVLSRQSQRLKKLVDDLMEMSRASSGNLPVEIETVDAVETVNQALGEFADKLEKVPLHPVFRQPEEPLLMRADGKLTWRVLSNLLSNASKYALPGTRLYVDVTPQEDKVVISLKNISREELNVEADELMERFVRGDVSRNTEGSGLGLNIASSLMQLQGGELRILVDGDLFKVTLVFPAE